MKITDILRDILGIKSWISISHPAYIKYRNVHYKMYCMCESVVAIHYSDHPPHYMGYQIMELYLFLIA